MPMPFNFAWSVNDGPSYNYYGHQSSSNGKVVTGSYHVALPDGRTQIVSYKADDYGYVADVKYEGEAKYPEQKATGYKSVDLIPPYWFSWRSSNFIILYKTIWLITYSVSNEIQKKSFAVHRTSQN